MADDDLTELLFDSLNFENFVSMILALMMAHDSWSQTIDAPPHSSIPPNRNCNSSFPHVSLGSNYCNHVDIIDCSFNLCCFTLSCYLLYLKRYRALPSNMNWKNSTFATL